MSWNRVWVAVVLLVLIGGACGGSSPDAAPGAASETTSDTASGTTSETESQPESTAVGEPTEPPASPTPEPTAPPAPTETPEPTPEPELAAIEPIGDGPYRVGVQTITIADEARDRPLTVDVWFPLAENAAGDAARYTFVTGDFYESPRALAADSTGASTDGPFPLVVYSHGSGGTRYVHSDYTETIASHGYVVVAPDHTGNTSVERVLGNPDPPELIAVNRPLDVIAVIDAMVDVSDPETVGLSALVDADRIAVTGHSFGGFTTFAVASGHSNSVGETPADDRVDALIPIAPAVGTGVGQTLLTTEQLSRISLPTLIIVGTDDKTTPVDPNVEVAWEHSAATPHYRLELVAAEHQTFTDICDYVESLANQPDANPLVVSTIESFAEEGCSADDMPIARAKDLTNTFAVTFLDSVFRDAEMISVDTHQIPDDVIYADR